jgi:hypothetical protein
VVNCAADQGFYAPVLLDEIAVTMRLDPDTPASALTPTTRVTAAPASRERGPRARMRLGGVAISPLALPTDVDLGASCSGPTCSPTGDDLDRRAAVDPGAALSFHAAAVNSIHLDRRPERRCGLRSGDGRGD